MGLTKKIKILELFAGSRSWGNVADELGHEVFSVDIKPFNKINLVIDIEFLDENMLPWIPDVVIDGRPCTTFSMAAISHHRYQNENPKTQFLKLQEESGELAKAILNQDQHEIIDALGDCLVVLINLSELCGYKLEDCLQSAYNEIKQRKGEMKNGTFIKEK